MSALDDLLALPGAEEAREHHERSQEDRARHRDRGCACELCKLLTAVAALEPAPTAPPMKPGRWWRVLLADGTPWAETSNETQARAYLGPVPGGKLQRLYQAEALTEWRDE